MQQLMSMNSNQTMTSKELVEVINAIRKEEGNDVEIQHSDLMRRIKGFEQILVAGSVAGDEYLGSNGQMRPMLLLIDILPTAKAGGFLLRDGNVLP